MGKLGRGAGAAADSCADPPPFAFTSRRLTSPARLISVEHIPILFSCNLAYTHHHNLKTVVLVSLAQHLINS